MGEELNILSYVVKWAVPFCCAGAFSLLITPLVKTFRSGKKVQDQEEWDAHLANSQVIKDMQAKEDKLEEKIDYLQDNVLNKIEENTRGIRKAILSSHLRELIVDGKHYLRQHYITPEQLADYNERFVTYKDLGGNGHVDPWIVKIRELPIKTLIELAEEEAAEPHTHNHNIEK